MMSISHNPTDDDLQQDASGAYLATPEPAFDRVHPGESLAEDLYELRLSVTKAARLLGVSRQTLQMIVNCKQSVTPEMALRIGKLIGNGPNLWLNLQRSWDLQQAKRSIGDQLEQIPTMEYPR
jgi:antitoxin HigA-1